MLSFILGLFLGAVGGYFLGLRGFSSLLSDAKAVLAKAKIHVK